MLYIICILHLQMYVRSFRRVYEAEIRQFMVDVKASLGAPMDLKRSKFLPKVCDHQYITRHFSSLILSLIAGDIKC